MAVSITASGQWWSDTKAWVAPAMLAWPNLRTAQLSASVLGSLSGGTVILLRRRLRAEFNGGTPGTTFPVLSIDATLVAARGVTGFTEDFYGVNSAYEYDIGCPTTFGAGDTVSVELV